MFIFFNNPFPPSPGHYFYCCDTQIQGAGLMYCEGYKEKWGHLMLCLMAGSETTELELAFLLLGTLYRKNHQQRCWSPRWTSVQCIISIGRNRCCWLETAVPLRLARKLISERIKSTCQINVSTKSFRSCESCTVQSASNHVLLVPSRSAWWICI